MAFSKNNTNFDLIDIKFNDTRLEITNEIKYLGFNLNNKIHFLT